MSDVLSEISALSSRDCFYIVERHKSIFSYPLHKHREYELNFVQHASGVKRIVGDSVETIGEWDLVLIAAENLEHAWTQGDCKSQDIREITVQFSPDLFAGEILGKNQFASICTMLSRASQGLSFPLEAIMKVYSLLDTLVEQQDPFLQYLDMLHILYDLSKFDGTPLSTSSFAHAGNENGNRRIEAVQKYVSEHFGTQIRLEDVAGFVGMSPSSFSRYFSGATGQTLSSYIIDVKLGAAARMLVDSARNISEICYACGFNNLSNFNRVFRSRRGMSPRDFRKIYGKTKIMV